MVRKSWELWADDYQERDEGKFDYAEVDIQIILMISTTLCFKHQIVIVNPTLVTDKERVIQATVAVSVMMDMKVLIVLQINVILTVRMEVVAVTQVVVYRVIARQDGGDP